MSILKLYSLSWHKVNARQKEWIPHQKIFPKFEPEIKNGEKKDECHTKIINFFNFFLIHTKSTLKIKNGLPAVSSAKSWRIFIANDAPWQVDSKSIGFILQKCFYQKLWGFEICRKHKVSTLLSKHYIPAEEVNHTKNLLSTTRIDFICDFSLSI